ncbi:MAG: hypothetical protein QM621_09090 [Aeromicrobium sp.]|uniref:hypothetical protein n=1 Tax=Aeromicrobium sp. TaxID=1871063 RepID=UPI0039E5FCA6
MRQLTPVPDHLAHRAFHRREALDAGLTDRMLEHARFVRVLPCVYRLATTELDRLGWIHAARLALPDDAALSHMSRLAAAGVDVGDDLVHFTIGRDLHLDHDGVMLHRTVRMPPLDSGGVRLSAAWVQSLSLLPPIRAIAAADRLLATEQCDTRSFAEVAARDPWRPGAAEVERVLPWLDGASASIPESQSRVVVVAAGLEPPEVNAPITDGPDAVAVGDLVFRRWRLVAEYEGRQHAEDVRQFEWDIERYRRLRELGWNYVQITARLLARPRALVTRIYRALLRQGYDGPEPVFGADWHWLFHTPLPTDPRER